MKLFFFFFLICPIADYSIIPTYVSLKLQQKKKRWVMRKNCRYKGPIDIFFPVNRNKQGIHLSACRKREHCLCRGKETCLHRRTHTKQIGGCWGWMPLASESA